MVAHEVAKGGFLNEHVKHIREVYKERRDVMIETLAEHMPPGVIWTKPEGGLFLWATAPKCVDCQDLFEDAVKEKVAFVPGFSFYAEGGGYNSMRLNFSNADPEHINEGIARLARVMKTHIKENGG
jgi:DNA-binding transcriptional MocR family regulator